MKGILKSIAGSLGYKIERSDNPNPLAPRNKQLLKELYGCYRDLKFAELPEADDTTLKLLSRLDGTQISESIYLLSGLQRTRSIPGDVCEFGVAQGYTSALLAYTIKNTTKNLWLFDSFEGLPAPTSKDVLVDDIFNLKSIEAYTGTMKHAKDSVMGNLALVQFPTERTRVVEGFLENVINKVTMPSSVSFAYVDFDFYQPIVTALDFLHTVLSDNGVVVVDDYNFFSAGAKTAVDEFYERNKQSYTLEFPIPSAGKFAVLTKKR